MVKINFKIIIVSLVLVVILGAAIFLYIFQKELNTPNTDIKENVLIQIQPGATTNDVAAMLLSQHLIKNETLYIYATKFFNKKVKSGYYEISANSSPVDIINLIDSGKVKVVKVTFPEGWRMEQIARKLNQEGILSYGDFVKVATPYEGKLFPDTYYFDPRMDAATVVKMMTDDYSERVSNLNVTKRDLTLASIVEKEAANDADRLVIAGIYTNRLNAKIKLQSDPTVAYARDSQNVANLLVTDILNYSFWKPAKTIEFTSVVSDFNTYQTVGLPPSPICNPGLKSIEAALNHQKNNYYYFLYGTDGKLHVSATAAEHQAQINEYM